MEARDIGRVQANRKFYLVQRPWCKRVVAHFEERGVEHKPPLLRMAQHIGKQKAHDLLEQASRQALAEGSSLLHLLKSMPEASEHFSSGQLAGLLDPRNYLGSTGAWISRVKHGEV